MATIPPNGFGSATYWNRPTSRSRSSRTRSLSPTNQQQPRSLSPTLTAPVIKWSTSSTTALPIPSNVTQGTSKPVVGFTAPLPAPPSYNMSPFANHLDQLYAERDKKDDKAMAKLMKSILPQFSNEHDWEVAAFELALALDRIWPHKQELNITDYLSTTYPHHDRDLETRADSLIYFALTLSAKKEFLRQTSNHGSLSSRRSPMCPPQRRKEVIPDVSILIYNYGSTYSQPAWRVEAIS